jgi:energy-coupling factor transporter ATP-binding protein EcfA2
MLEPIPESPPFGIVGIEVESLFGMYDHNLRAESADADLSRLIILYGENGTGKTTLLWLLYHLLNKRPGERHRTFLAKSRFKRLSVFFANGTEITAFRAPGSLTGTFKMAMKLGRVTHQFTYKTDDEGAIPNLGKNEEHSKFNSRLPELHFTFLAHDRLHPVDQPELERLVARQRAFARLPLAERIGRGATPPEVLRETLDSVRAQAITASGAGEKTANSIYSELITRIATLDAQPRHDYRKLRSELTAALGKQASSIAAMSEFGLMSELEVGDLINTITSADDQRLPLIAQVLQPFLDSNQARISALNPLHLAITTVVQTINSFYRNKLVAFNLRSGINVHTPDRQVLDPSELSSGERQLLVLFCGALISLHPNTLVFVDEPELSLNVSWQRGLVQALLRCVSRSSTQFVMATHSLELLGRHRANVVKLSSIGGGGRTNAGADKSES